MACAARNIDQVADLEIAAMQPRVDYQLNFSLRIARLETFDNRNSWIEWVPHAKH